jgi:hypothetical protein
MRNKDMKETDSSRARPGFIAFAAGALLVILIPLCLYQMKRPPGDDTAESATLEVVGVRDSSAAPGEGFAPRAIANPTAPTRVFADPQDSEYRQRVSQAVERVYANLVKTNTSAETVPANAALNASATTGPHAPGAGIRNYVATERTRRALSQELRLLRRAAIAQAHPSATNSVKGPE